MSRGRGQRRPDFKRLKRIREASRDGQLSTQERTMPPDQVYIAPNGRPRSTPPERLSDLLPFPVLAALAVPAPEPLVVVGAATLAPVKPRYHSERWYEGRKSAVYRQRAAAGQMNAAIFEERQARKLCRQLNTPETVGCWMTVTQYARLMKIQRRHAADKMRHEGWAKQVTERKRPIYLVPPAAIMVMPAPAVTDTEGPRPGDVTWVPQRLPLLWRVGAAIRAWL